MTTTGALVLGRKSFDDHAWPKAFAQLSAADRYQPLEPSDLERLAFAACLVGKENAAVDAWARAHQAWLLQGDPARAARCAFWAAFWSLINADLSRGSGWLTRSRTILDEYGRECVEQGYVLIPLALGALFRGDVATAEATFRQACEIGERFRDNDLTAIGRLGRGQSLVAMGRAAQGVAFFDDVIVAVTTGEISPVVVGIVYCAALESCTSIFDLRRAREWTAALSKWCESQPGLVPFRGQCLVHRAEVMQTRGDWPGALIEAEQACVRLTDRPALGLARYRVGELHRLRGEFNEAEEAYREANRRGRIPQPGLALLRLAQGQVDAAFAAIKRAVQEARDQPSRAQLLGAYVEIALAAKDVPAAQNAAGELVRIATEVGGPYLQALSAQMTGAVLLASDDAGRALAELRRAWSAWQEIDAPYEAARARVLLALACRALGDEDGAEMELDAARWVFGQLGAAPDLSRLEQLSGRARVRDTHGLTLRELEVLRLVAAGKTNREIATALVISDHTVRRHLQNVFGKLGVSSRAAATAYAFQHSLI